MDNKNAEAKFDNFFKPDRIVIVGVWDKENLRTNLITIGFISYLGIGDGQIIAFPVHPTRHSHKLFLEEKHLVVNLLNVEQYEAAHLCGTVSGRKGDKYKLAGLKPFKIDGFDTRVEAIKESPYVLVAEKVDVCKLSGCSHDLVVGKPIKYLETGSKSTKPLWHVSEENYYELYKAYGGKGYKGGYGSCKIPK